MEQLNPASRLPPKAPLEGGPDPAAAPESTGSALGSKSPSSLFCVKLSRPLDMTCDAQSRPPSQPAALCVKEGRGFVTVIRR